jgi:predicted small secreted protein
MKIYLLLSSFVLAGCFSLLTGCQGTAAGFTNDVSRNTAAVRKEINEN